MTDNKFLGAFYVLVSGFFLLFANIIIGPKEVWEIILLVICVALYSTTYDKGYALFFKVTDDSTPKS